MPDRRRRSRKKNARDIVSRAFSFVIPGHLPGLAGLPNPGSDIRAQRRRSRAMHDSRESMRIWQLHHAAAVNRGRLSLVKDGRRLTAWNPVPTGYGLGYAAC
jgi:hypothetical protein